MADSHQPFDREAIQTENLRRSREKYPRHFQLAEEMLALASEALLEFRRRGLGPKQATPAQYAAQLLFMKGYKSFWSVIQLCERLLTDDAAIVLRSLFNLLVVACWVKADAKRAEWYREWFAIAAARFVRPDRLGRHPPLFEAHAEAEEFFRRDGPKPGHVPKEWHGSTIELMASEVGLADHYKIVYRSLSSIEHSDVMSHIPAMGLSAGYLLWSDRMIGEYLGLSYAYFGRILGEWNETFGILDTARIQQLLDRGARELVRPEFRPGPAGGTV